MDTNTKYNLTKVDAESYNLAPGRYELRSGMCEGAPTCPYGNTFQWIGYDIVKDQYVRFTKSVFKRLVSRLEKKEC